MHRRIEVQDKSDEATETAEGTPSRDRGNPRGTTLEDLLRLRGATEARNPYGGKLQSALQWNQCLCGDKTELGGVAQHKLAPLGCSCRSDRQAVFQVVRWAPTLPP